MNPGDAQADGLDVQTALHMTLAENREAIAEFKARAVKSARARAALPRRRMRPFPA